MFFDDWADVFLVCVLGIMLSFLAWGIYDGITSDSACRVTCAPQPHRMDVNNTVCECATGDGAWRPTEMI